MQQSRSQRTRRCFRQQLPSHQLAHSWARSPRNGCDTASPRWGLRGAEPLSLPTGCARRRPSLPREETTWPPPLQQLWAGTAVPWERRWDTRRASSPGQQGLLPGLTPLFKGTANPLCLVTTASSRGCSAPQFPHQSKIPFTKPPLSCLIFGTMKTTVRLATLAAPPVPGRAGGDAPAHPTPSHPPLGRLH